MISRRLTILLVAALGSWTGCRNADQSGAHPSPPDGAVTRTAQRGPVKMTVTAGAGEITIADKLQLTIEVTAAEGVDVDMPEFGQQLNEFIIRDFRRWPAVVQDGVRRWRQEYELDIFLSGDYSIPGISAKFVDRRGAESPSAEAVSGEIATEPITIKVKSLLAGEFDPAKFADIKGVVELPRERRWAWLGWLGGGLALAAVSAVLIVRWRRRNAARAERPIPAHEWALQELARLEEGSRRDDVDVHELYFALSSIVRQYIERRFAIMAAEQTTQEFLAGMKDQPVLSADHKALLRGFLQAADLVKFALYRPDGPEIDRAFTAAKGFVHQTTVQDRPQEAAA